MDAVISRLIIFDNITGPVTLITNAVDELINGFKIAGTTTQDLDGSPFESIRNQLDAATAAAERTGNVIEQIGPAINDLDGSVLDTIENRLDAVTASLTTFKNLIIPTGSMIDMQLLMTKDGFIRAGAWVSKYAVKAAGLFSTIANTVSGGLSIAWNKVTGIVGSIANTVGTGARAAIGAVAGGIGAVTGKLAGGLSIASRLLNPLVSGLSAVGRALGAIGGGAVAFAGKIGAGIDKVMGLINSIVKPQAIIDFFKDCAMMDPKVKEMTGSIEESFNSIKAKIGQQLAPALINVLTIIQNHMPQIEQMLMAVVPIIQVIIDIIGEIIEAAFSVYNVFRDYVAANLQPILIALAVLLGLVAIKATIAGIAAFLAFLKATWPLLLIIAIIVAVIMAVHSMGASFEEIFGFIGLVAGLAIAGIVNTFIDFWNFIAGFVNNFARIFDDPIAAIVGVFLSLFTFISKQLAKIASVIDKIFGSGISDAISGFNNRVEDWYAQTFGPTEEFVAKMEHVNSDEWGAKGAELGGKFGAFLDNPSFPEITAIADSPSFPEMAAIADNTANTAGNTKKSADFSEENLVYLRDISERDAINRFTTAEIHIEQHNENHISSEMDLDGVIGFLAAGAREAIEESAEGVHI